MIYKNKVWCRNTPSWFQLFLHLETYVQLLETPGMLLQLKHETFSICSPASNLLSDIKDGSSLDTPRRVVRGSDLSTPVLFGGLQWTLHSQRTPPHPREVTVCIGISRHFELHLNRQYLWHVRLPLTETALPPSLPLSLPPSCLAWTGCSSDSSIPVIWIISRMLSSINHLTGTLPIPSARHQSRGWVF